MGNPMDVKLVVIGGKNAGRAVPVPGPEFLIGRSEECHLRPQSNRISRKHAAIRIEEGFAGVRDFGSSNGTFVNGERVEGEQQLKNGDRLMFGPLEFEVQLAVEIGGKKKPKVNSVSEAAARTVRSAHDDQLDIFGLLGEEEEANDQEDTKNIRSTQTLGSGLSDTVATKPEAEENPEEPPEQPAKKKAPLGLVGQFDEGKKPAAESSRSAAEEMLKLFAGKKR